MNLKVQIQSYVFCCINVLFIHSIMVIVHFLLPFSLSFHKSFKTSFEQCTLFEMSLDNMNKNRCDDDRGCCDYDDDEDDGGDDFGDRYDDNEDEKVDKD